MRLKNVVIVYIVSAKTIGQPYFWNLLACFCFCYSFLLFFFNVDLYRHRVRPFPTQTVETKLITSETHAMHLQLLAELYF